MSAGRDRRRLSWLTSLDLMLILGEFREVI